MPKLTFLTELNDLCVDGSSRGGARRAEGSCAELAVYGFVNTDWGLF